MRRKRAFTRGRVFSILVAAAIGYLLGSWSATAVRSSNASAAQTVALRFPQDWNDTATTEAVDQQTATTTFLMGSTQLALFDPTPMVPQVAVQPAVVETASPPAAPQPPVSASAHAVPDRKLTPPVSAVRPIAVVTHRPTPRPGLMLDNSQIASIKARLHLTPDQESMWPAVEAALRNIAYVRQRHGVQVGAIDPNSAEVQDLKSAAIPLIMSFDSEQRDEVRNLAHVMGLDQLAAQF